MADPKAPAAAKKTLYIETVGCQMNVLDSELVVGMLRDEGYELTDDIDRADTILYNTCSVRQHAEDKIYSALGRIRRLKERKPEVAIGVLGCMAQKDQGQILRRAPHVDVVIGPGQLARVPELLAKAKDESKPQMAVSLPRNAGTRDAVTASFAEYDPLRDPEMRPSPFQAYLRIMMGCDKFCTYCVVPAVRGPEQSRPPDAIVAEGRRLVDQGVVEITLLGQTVNSYKYKDGDGRTTRLSDLLARLHDIDGLRRLKFITNFPNDMTDDLLAAVRDLPKVSRYLHVPAQSGCDDVLARMKRLYTVALYDEMLDRIRETIPGSAVSSDFIVGFCGESEASFEKSLALVERARFKNSFIFKYSPRTGTKADSLYADDVPEDVKRRRNNALLAAQTAISLEDNQGFVGKAVEVLVEGPSKASKGDEARGPGPLQLTGRTWCDRIVVFDGNERQVGRFARVVIERASAVTLFGAVETIERGASA
ncbi:MAG TPA: tRNA (N6-isopentenyl adenosine(37)-C2)-methylthiotransferase MiaB [Isosphaeraceae bacterium]|jgi:tRNA-2-methylthio-N6-dimethylallyladenosine synthase|nr:tRNA (N6-isopentenyl adenosine(37)-C2)-methylthiotransferase MiaB [Isosphaeraceae bacterium]